MRKDNIVDNFHGTLVADPYRYLEDTSDPDTTAFIARHDARAVQFFSDIPAREPLRERLAELWNHPRYTVPQRVGTRYFFQKNDGLQNQAVLYMQEGLEGTPRVLLDPNTFSADGTVAITSVSVSKCGKSLAYARSVSGSDWQEIRVLAVDNGQEDPDVLHHVKFTNIAWLPDGSGFFYSRFQDPTTAKPGEESYHNKVYFHTLGTAQSDDKLIYERPDFRELGFSPAVSEDGKYLFLTVWHGTDPVNRFYYQELGSQAGVVKLLDTADAAYHILGNEERKFYFYTTLDAPRGRIVAIDINHPAQEHWQTIVPETNESIDQTYLINEQLVITYLRHAHHAVRLFTLNGASDGTVELPTLGSVTDVSGKKHHDAMFFSFTSFLFPATVFRYDFKTRSLAPVWGSTMNFDHTAYEAKQVFYPSRDGTQVPLFIVHKRGLSLDGKAPVLLYGYGGFNISMTPSFSEGVVAWLERDGVWAEACLRGGGEYGEDWHRAGMLANKQNVFDDFHAAAEFLVRENYTSRQRLAIMGGSNGGLLVAACMTQRPELYGAVVCRVPVIDMLRYHKFTVGRYWVGEYGNADADPEHFRFMYAYSPLHNVRAGVDYPPTLIMTADTDDRVVPAHAFKYMATLEEHYKGDNPIIMRVEMKAGHGAGKPTSKIIAESADMYAFLAKVIG
ncbi:MAG: Prolyl endopeptidase [Firmicutes bacterium]|nr:Prolyl endopeptidase [candidate division NPL-UPA2 bacterium]